MRRETRRMILIASIATVLAGCASDEYGQPVAGGWRPWYSVNVQTVSETRFWAQALGLRNATPESTGALALLRSANVTLRHGYTDFSVTEGQGASSSKVEIAADLKWASHEPVPHPIAWLGLEPSGTGVKPSGTMMADTVPVSSTSNSGINSRIAPNADAHFAHMHYVTQPIFIMVPTAPSAPMPGARFLVDMYRGKAPDGTATYNAQYVHNLISPLFTGEP